MKRGIGLHVGSSSILVVFVLLCLTTFATLSMVSANADYRIMQKSADASDRYYRADTASEGLVARIDLVLQESYAASIDGESYRQVSQQRITGVLEDMVVPESWGVIVQDPRFVDGVDERYYTIPYWMDGSSVTYQIPMSDDQALEVVLELPYPAQDGALYRRARWQVINLEDQEYETIDEGMDLWDGGDILDFLDLG